MEKMSRTVVPITPSKQVIKKAQSLLKPLVALYGSFVISWANDVEEVARLLEHLVTLSNKKVTIELCSSQNGFFTTVVNDSNMVCSKIVSSILLEMESSLMQIRTFEKRIGDTLCAMTVTYEDAMKVVQNESIELFDDSAIFTADHVLEMQQLQKGYMLEMHRKAALLSPLYGHGRPSNSSSRSTDKEASSWSGMPALPTLQAVDVATLQEALQQYPDSAEASYIPIESVEIFLLKNNIRASS